MYIVSYIVLCVNTQLTFVACVGGQFNRWLFPVTLPLMCTWLTVWASHRLSQFFPQLIQRLPGAGQDELAIDVDGRPTGDVDAPVVVLVALASILAYSDEIVHVFRSCRPLSERSDASIDIILSSGRHRQGRIGLAT